MSALQPATSSDADRHRSSGQHRRGITTVLPIVERIARTQPQRTVVIAHADRRAPDHALRDTVLRLGREIDDFSSYTWYETRR